MDPRVLLLDEPTNGLDPAAEDRLLTHLSGFPGGMIIVTHDPMVLDRLGARRLRLAAGRVSPETC